HAVLEVVKTNYARPPAPVGVVMHAGGHVGFAGPAATCIDELVDARDPRRDRHEAVAFLREFLGERDERAERVLEQAKGLGCTEITIRRAKKDAGVTSYRDPHWRGIWMWRLAEATHPRRGE